MVKCARCGLMRLSPQPAPERLRSYYPAHYWFAPGGSAASRLEEAYRRVVLRDHLSFLLPAAAGGPLLDAGCGGGLLLAMARQRGVRGIGLDTSQEAARIASSRLGVPVVCASLDHAPFPDGRFRAISMYHVLEHLANPRAYLRAAHRLLAPEGRLIVQVPNAASWQARLLGRRWNGLDIPRHLFDFRECDLAGLLDAAGFQVVRRKHFSLRDNPAGFASSLAPSLDPMARRVRGVREGGTARLWKDLAYFGLLLAGLPFTALEAAFGAGSTIMLDARKKA